MDTAQSPTLDTVDYCSVGCDPSGIAITEWGGEKCKCCNGTWGEGGGTCRHQHLSAETWALLLDAEQEPK